MADESAEIFDDLYLGLRAGGAVRKRRRGEPLSSEEEEAIGRWHRLSTWRKSLAIGGFAIGTFGLGFTLGGAVAGLSGALFVHYSTYIDHDMVALPLALASVTYPILGGLGSFVGPLLGTTVLVSLTEGLRGLHEFREFVYGALIIVMMIFRPRGIVDEALVQRVRSWFRPRAAAKPAEAR